ncbi:MAG: Gfo/Idh/MocA family protein [Candidatus Zipacnadales bacterium]
MGEREISRRNFLAKTSTAVATAPLFLRQSVFGANDRLALGIVGAGGRGGGLMKWAQDFSEVENVEFQAVCDIWNQRREAGAARIKEWTGKDPKQYRTLGEICADPDIDALIIATPDFAHAYHCRIAVEAGKDVYVEKPLGCDFRQIKLCWEAVKASDRVVQMGTQRRGDGKYEGAKQFIKSGALGRITYGEIYEPLFQQRWRIPGAETSLTEKDTIWSEFLAYAPYEPFNARKYREFRLFWPYSSGCFCQWMSHKIDLVNWVLDEIPCSAVAWGGLYAWPDGRTNPDTVQCLLEYPSGCMVTYHMRLGNGANGRGITLYGTNGTMELEAGLAYGDGGGGTITLVEPGNPNTAFQVDQSTVLPSKKEGGVRWESPPDVDHMQDFLRCVRTRQQPRGHIDAGYAHAVATTLANMAYRNKCQMVYDHSQMIMKKA